MRKKKITPADDVPEFQSFEEFDALSDADKEKVDRYYDRKIPMSETRPLNAQERAQHERILGRSVGRPKIGQGAKVVAVTLEKGFLRQVDDYAAKHKMKRAELIVQGLRMAMGSAPANKPRQRKSA